MIPDFARLLLGWLVLAVTCHGLGRPTARLLVGRRARSLSAFHSLWIGFVAVLAFAQLWHLVAPIDWRATLTVVGAGLIGAATHRARLPRPTPIVLLWLVIVAALAAWVAFYAMGAPAEYDSGLYHFNAVRWHNEHPIVPGLGNLHFRLAFNNSSFGFVALCNVHPWFGHGHNLANSFLIVVLLAQGAWAALRLARRRITAAIVFEAALLPVALLYVSNAISSPSTDRPVLVLAMAMAAVTVDLVHRRQQTALFAVALFLAAGALTLKLSAAATCGALMLSAGIGHAMRRRRSKRWWWLRAVLCSAVLVIPWAARGCITSGYPAYPASIGALDVDWRIPADDVNAQRLDTYQWARDYTTDPRTHRPLREWFPAWSNRALTTKEVRAALLGLAAGTAAWLACVGVPGALSALLRCLSLLLPALLGVAFWFQTAPDPRFGAIALWLTGLLPVACAAPVLRARVTWLAGALAACVLAATLAAFTRPRAHDWGLLDEFRSIPTRPLREFRTAGGLVIFVPVKGDQVWDSPLPATPDERADLTARGTTLSAGFRR